MKKTRWDKTYWVGWGGNGPHIPESGMPELFTRKSCSLSVE